jgi:esterase/lipase superfamily enzyme
MQTRHDRWHSPILGIEMPIVIYGHWGAPLLLFPTAAADCYEYERFGLVDYIAHHLEAGRL